MKARQEHAAIPGGWLAVHCVQETLLRKRRRPSRRGRQCNFNHEWMISEFNLKSDLISINYYEYIYMCIYTCICIDYFSNDYMFPISLIFLLLLKGEKVEFAAPGF